MELIRRKHGSIVNISKINEVIVSNCSVLDVVILATTVLNERM